MLKAYRFTFRNGTEITIRDVKRLDDTHNTYSVYNEDDVLAFSVPVDGVDYVGITNAETNTTDDEPLIKAEGSE